MQGGNLLLLSAFEVVGFRAVRRQPAKPCKSVALAKEAREHLAEEAGVSPLLKRSRLGALTQRALE